MIFRLKINIVDIKIYTKIDVLRIILVRRTKIKDGGV